MPRWTRSPSPQTRTDDEEVNDSEPVDTSRESPAHDHPAREVSRFQRGEPAKAPGHDWGRILICGGTNWERNAHPPSSNTKGVTLTDDDHTVPVKPRYISHLKITQVIGGPSANYSIAIDLAGTAHIFGRIPYFGVKDLSKGNIWNVVSVNEPLHIPGPDGGKWEGGAVGAGHFLLFSGSKVYGAGDNRARAMGIADIEFATKLTHIPGPWEEAGRSIKQVATGQTFTLFLDDHHRVYAAGKSEYGQLGNGTTGEIVLRGAKMGYAYVAPPIPVEELQMITEIACGNYHALALDICGRVFTWGNNTYGSLGLGDLGQHRLSPTHVRELPQAATGIYAGPASSIVVLATPEGECQPWVAGRCKLAGPGSSSSPYSRFEKIPLSSVQDDISMGTGFISHFATIVGDDDMPRTYAWGQGATHGELGIGKEWLSASDPTPIAHLDGIDVLSVAAGLVHTVFLVRPDETLEERIGLAAGVDASDDEDEDEAEDRGKGKGKRKAKVNGNGKSNKGNGWTKKAKKEDKKGKGKAKAPDDDDDPMTPNYPSEEVDERDLAIERWPPVESKDYCLRCQEGEVEDMTFLECERCEEGYHMECLQPVLIDVPEGEWFCLPCEDSAYEWSHPPRA